jgi:hypothetical protein
MSDRYLWDRSGPPDPEVERLEKLLAPLAHRPAGGPRLAVAPPRPRPWRAMAAAAALILAAASLLRFETSSGDPTGWQIARVDGAARVGSGEARPDMELRAGQVVRTGRNSELLLQDDDLGRVDVGPESEMRAAGVGRLALRRGSLHAFIWAPPRRFVVDTPSARAIDLGCEYTIDVDRNGDGLLQVSLGWVAFQHDGRESFIPAGARCMTRRRTGPGIPYYADAPDALAQAVGRFDRGDAAAIPTILSAARQQDGLTLWHLMTRVPPQARGQVFDRFASLVKLPPEATREKAIAGDAGAIDLCWNALDLQSTDWWRGWERDWRR